MSSRDRGSRGRGDRGGYESRRRGGAPVVRLGGILSELVY